MAVSVVGSDASVTDGESYTPGAGSDRLVLWTLGAKTGGSVVAQIVNATYDGEAATADGLQSRTAGVSTISNALFRALEADLPAGAGVLDATFSETPGQLFGAAITLAGVDQASPVLASQVINKGGGDATHEFPTLTVVAGGLVVISVSGVENITPPAGYTVVANDATLDVLLAYKAIASGTTEDIAFITANTSFLVATAVCYKPAAAAGGGIIVPTLQGFNFNSFIRV